MRELQDIVDDLAATLGRAISVEDRRYRLLAHSAQQRFADRVRRDSILERRADPPVIAYLRGYGVEHAEAIVQIPACADLGMAARTCHPLRMHDTLLGFLWVLDGDRALSAWERDALVASATIASEDLWRRREQRDEERRRRRAQLGALLQGGDGARTAGVSLAAASELGTGPFAVAIAPGDETLARGARRRWPHGRALAGEHGGGAVLIAGVATSSPRALGDCLCRAGADRAFVGRPVDALGGLSRSLRDAEVAVWAGRADSKRFGTVVTYEELGGWAVVVELWLASGRPAPPPHVEALARHRAGDELLEAAEALLDNPASDMASIAERLHVHRGTLYRRIERIREITGLDVGDGDDRLELHLALRLRRLQNVALCERDVCRTERHEVATPQS